MESRKIKYLIHLVSVGLLISILILCHSIEVSFDSEVNLVLSDSSITADGKNVNSRGDIFISNDVIYYEAKDVYASGNPYGEGLEDEKHSAEEAASVTVLNITQPGTYRLSGKLSQGQIRVDLGEHAYKDKSAIVTLIFDGVDVKCDIAPAVLFLNVYECDTVRSVESAVMNIDTSSAGANIIIADGTVNNIEGSYVAKIYQDKVIPKKKWKQDGALSSYMSINISGEEKNSGILNITADKEGISSETHLTVNGGNINIWSQDDGINTSELNISVTTINDGNIHIAAGLGVAGDGIDSNGWIVVNGGTTVSVGHPKVDSGLDNENGFYANGGTFVSLGNVVDWSELDSNFPTLNLQFQQEISSNNAITFTDLDGSVVFCYSPPQDETISQKLRDCCGIVIVSPNFEIGKQYNMYIGGTVNGQETMGFYDISTITEFEGAVQQMFLSDEDFDYGGFKSEDNKEYFPDTLFNFSKTVNCFAKITNSDL